MIVNTPRDWGNIVRDRRVQLGMTQEELAAHVDRARQWVVRFESGHAGSANVESLGRVLDVLGLLATVDIAGDEEDLDSVLLDAVAPDAFDR